MSLTGEEGGAIDGALATVARDSRAVATSPADEPTLTRHTVLAALSTATVSKAIRARLLVIILIRTRDSVYMNYTPLFVAHILAIRFAREVRAKPPSRLRTYQKI
jgi:hypothetical protein